MNPKYLLGLLVALQLAVNVFATINEYFYEFGVKGSGQQIYTKDGQIHLLEYNNYINIPVPANTEVTYVSVRVNAFSPPKVDYDAERDTVNINYSILELPVSSYSITVNGVNRYG